MMLYRMRQTRRALIRRALATALVAAPAPPNPRPNSPRVRREPARMKRKPATAVDPNRFAHFSTPEAAAQFRTWQANTRRDDD